jgi:hypothetical protein
MPQPSRQAPPPVYRPTPGLTNGRTSLQPKEAPFRSQPLPGSRQRAVQGNQANNSAIQPSAKGFLKFLYAKLALGSVRSEISTYRLRPGARARFLDSVLTHAENREYYSHRGDNNEQALAHQQRLQEAREEDPPDLPETVEITTTATLSRADGVYGQGTLHAEAHFNSEVLEERAAGSNHLDAELGQDKAGNWFVDVNALYSYPIGSGVGQILLYEAGYLAVRNGYKRFSYGAGEGTAAAMWRDRYQNYVIRPAQRNREEEGLVDTRPAPKDNVLSRHMLIGAWIGLSSKWEKVGGGCCCC